MSMRVSNGIRTRDYTVAGCRITAILYPHKMPYSELTIGTPYLESNQLLKCVHHEEPHSSLRFSGKYQFTDWATFIYTRCLSEIPEQVYSGACAPILYVGSLLIFSLVRQP